MILEGKRPLGWLLLISLSIIWGSSFILMHEGLKCYTAIEMASFRLCIAGLLFIPFSIYIFRKKYLKDLHWFILAGLLGNFFPAFFFAYAQTYIQSSTAGALNTLTPFFTLISGVLLFSKKFSRYKILGVLLGFAGALSLVLNKPQGGIETHPEYSLLAMLATLFYGINVNIIESKLSKFPPVTIAAIPISLVSIPAFGILSFIQFPIKEVLSPEYINGTLSVVTLGLFGTAIGLILFNRLIQISSGLFASTVTYLMPIVSSLWGIYFNEAFGVVQFVSLGLILIGVLVVRRY
ncbi:MAG: DMT family transporter [Flavobacteriales bacterium]|nr:DMT family transporter [Flavobacteriales bacterium]